MANVNRVSASLKLQTNRCGNETQFGVTRASESLVEGSPHVWMNNPNFPESFKPLCTRSISKLILIKRKRKLGFDELFLFAFRSVYQKVFGF